MAVFGFNNLYHYDSSSRVSGDFIPFRQFEQDISPVEHALSRKAYDEIIKKSEFFWLAFCKALSQLENQNKDLFSTALQEKTLFISGRDHIISKVQKTVEEIRKLFAKSQTEKTPSFLVLPIKVAHLYFIREKADHIDITDLLGERQINCSETWFEAFIHPCMQSFCESIGTVCSDVVVPQKVTTPLFVSTEDVKAFKIDWTPESHFVYPIPVKKIPQRDDLQQSMYSLYEKQILCDLTLVAEDGEVHIHSTPLYTYGGEMIQKMLTLNMKESKEKTVFFSEFSLNCVRAFVDFIYLGEKGLEPESFLKKGVDVCELLHMAHMYQVTSLVDCCTNLLGLFTCPSEAEKIKSLAERYNNEHLKKLHEHFVKDPD